MLSYVIFCSFITVKLEKKKRGQVIFKKKTLTNKGEAAFFFEFGTLSLKRKMNFTIPFYSAIETEQIKSTSPAVETLLLLTPLWSMIHK